MKIKQIRKATVHFVETDEEDYYEYTRYSEENWCIRMGESDEPVYNCKEIEEMFQRELEKNKLNKEEQPKKCKFCIHFNNNVFDNKQYGYCQKLFQEIYTEDKEENILDDEKVVTNSNFGCILFEKKP